MKRHLANDHRIWARCHLNNQTNNNCRKTAMNRTAMSRSLMVCHLEPRNKARICCSSAWTCDVSVASLSAVSRCWQMSGSSNCCNDTLSQTALGSCTMPVSARSQSSTNTTSTYTTSPVTQVSYIVLWCYLILWPQDWIKGLLLKEN